MMQMKELATDVSFAYQREIEKAKRAVLKRTYGILPPRETREGLEYFASQWCKKEGYSDVLRDDEEFDLLVDTALRMVRGFLESTVGPPSEESDLDGRREARRLCRELKVPYREEFTTEADVLESLLDTQGYHKWLSYARLKVEGRLGSDISRERDKLEASLRDRLGSLRQDTEAEA